MSTWSTTHDRTHHDIETIAAQEAAGIPVLLGRIFFAAIFVITSFNHFSQSDISYAAAHGVPLPELLVPLSGILALIGGLSVALGYYARVGAGLLILFLIPVTLMMHNFWVETDPVMAQNQMAHFCKNISMIGGALMITFFGAGPFSFDRVHLTRAMSAHHVQRDL